MPIASNVSKEVFTIPTCKFITNSPGSQQIHPRVVFTEIVEIEKDYHDYEYCE
jgi:hypothetical protein